MNTLLIRIAAPMQSWGVGAKFERRGTEREPTKSGVIGLIAAALGRRRNEKIDDLANLNFGVRVDREGTLISDYHTAKSKTHPYVTRRYYLSDAVFLVGLEGDDALLENIEQALAKPVFPLFLGRRSCPPEGKISLGIRKCGSLINALQEEPCLVELCENSDSKYSMRVVIDTQESGRNTYAQKDFPVSFDPTHRRSGFRIVKEIAYNANIREKNGEKPRERQTAHDPFAELEED